MLFGASRRGSQGSGWGKKLSASLLQRTRLCTSVPQCCEEPREGRNALCHCFEPSALILLTSLCPDLSHLALFINLLVKPREVILEGSGSLCRAVVFGYSAADSGGGGTPCPHFLLLSSSYPFSFEIRLCTIAQDGLKLTTYPRLAPNLQHPSVWLLVLGYSHELPHTSLGSAFRDQW